MPHEAQMKSKITPRLITKGLAIAGIPAGVVVATMLPLRPIFQQALVGIVLIWLYVAMIVFQTGQ